MKYFLAILPPPDVTQQVEEFRAPWGRAKTAPHITVKAPNSLDEPRRWLPQVAELCQQVAPFEVTLAGVDQFGAAVLYLRVVASVELTGLHQSLLRIANPSLAEQAEYFEGPHYLPHLTLAHRESGIPAATLATMLPLAQTRWSQPIRFVTNSLVVYQSAGAGQPFEPYHTLPLTGRPPARGEL